MIGYLDRKPLQQGQYVWAEPKANFWEASKAAFDRTVQLDNNGRRAEYLRQAQYKRYQQIHNISGKNMPIPVSVFGQAMRNMGQSLNQRTGGGAATAGILPTLVTGLVGAAQKTGLFNKSIISDNDFEAMLETERAKNPENYKNIETDDEFRNRIAKELQLQRHEFDSIIENSKHPFLANLSGGAVAGFTDPLNLLTMGISGGASATMPVLKSVGIAALSNAGTEALQVPFRAMEQTNIEKTPYTLGQGAMDIGAAAIFGAAFEGAGHLVSPLLKKALVGKNPQKIIQAAKIEPIALRETRIENAPDAAARGLARETSLKIEDSKILDELDLEDANLVQDLMAVNTIKARMGEPMDLPPSNLGKNEAKNLDAIFSDIPENMGGDSQPIRNPSATLNDFEKNNLGSTENNLALENELDLTSRTSPEPIIENNSQILRAADYRGRTIYQGRFNPNELKADPKTFQYKGGGDGEGITNKLKGVTKWDDTRSGKTIIWEDVNGNQFVADGHQRRGLAKKLANAGDSNAQLDGYLFRAKDGWSAGEVRVIAAIKNIGENSGDVIDAAKVFREAPHEADGSLPLTGAIARDGIEIAKLSDEAFEAIVNKVYPEADGAIVGKIASEYKLMHEGMLKILKDGNYTNRAEKELAIRKLLLENWVKDTAEGQSELFDLGGLVPELFHEKNKVINAAINGLKRHAGTFEFLVAKSELYENVGNILARDVNELEAQAANAAAGYLSRLADIDGPIKDTIMVAARDVANGKKPSDVINNVIKTVREITENKTLNQLTMPAELPTLQVRENMAGLADSVERYNYVEPIDTRDDFTKDMFGDLLEEKNLIDEGEKNLQTISVCAPK